VPPFVVAHTPSWHPGALPQFPTVFGAIDCTCA
jgi:hypothetical protein